MTGKGQIHKYGEKVPEKREQTPTVNVSKMESGHILSGLVKLSRGIEY